MDRKKGKEMKIWVPPFEFYNCILVCDLAEMVCVCVFFFLLSNFDFAMLIIKKIWNNNLEWKRSFSSKKTSVACTIGPSVTTSSTDFSSQNLVFWNLFEFSVTEITQKSISPKFWIQILPNKFH
jgi:hypothetical protein